MVAARAQTWLWATWPIQVLELCSRMSGPQFNVDLVGGRTMLVVSDPAAVKDVFKLCPHAGNDELGPFLGRESLFMLRDQPHKIERRRLTGALSRALEDLDLAKIFTGVLDEELGLQRPFNPFIVFRKATLIAMWTVCFGRRRLDPLVLAEIEALFDATTAWEIYSHEGQITNQSLSKRVSNIKLRLAGEVAEAVAEGSLGAGVASEWANNGDTSGSQMTDEICAILAAGSEPAASGLAWAVLFLERFPDARHRLDDLRSGSGAAAAGWMDAICREVLRFMPVVPVVDRVVDENISVAGRDLRPGDRVAACSYLTHRNLKAFDNPKLFQPERFVSREYSPYEYYPFGGGVRRCIGSTIAMDMMRTGLEVFTSGYRADVTHLHGLPVQMRGVVLTPRTRNRVSLRRK